MDLALRRRFYFVEFHPDDDPVKSVLRRWLSEKAPDMEWVADVVERANDRLREDRHAAIGPSYFMKDDLDEAMRSSASGDTASSHTSKSASTGSKRKLTSSSWTV